MTHIYNHFNGQHVDAKACIEKESHVTTSNDNFGTIILGRQVSHGDGMYMEGKVQGVKVTFTADTGAARTVVSKHVYLRIPDEMKPILRESSSLVGADGQPLRELGRAIFGIEIGTLELEQEVIVAEIEDDVLLGLDVLKRGDEGPCFIDLDEGQITINGVTIQCTSQSNNVRKVTVADDYEVPANSEMIVDVFVERNQSDNSMTGTEFLIEPCKQFMEDHPLVVSSTLVDIGREVTSKGRIMNPYDKGWTIHQNTVWGSAETQRVQNKPWILLPSAGENDQDDFSHVRRIKLDVPTKPVDWETNVDLIRSQAMAGSAGSGKSGIVAQHFEHLHDQATTDLNDMDKTSVAQLLAKYGVLF